VLAAQLLHGAHRRSSLMIICATLALHPDKRIRGVRKFRSYEEMKARDD
jgi:hypothetical protein